MGNSSILEIFCTFGFLEKMEITKEKVLDALSNVIDPDLGKDLVTLNMIKDIEIDM